jgi:hypothetical protein
MKATLSNIITNILLAIIAICLICLVFNRKPVSDAKPVQNEAKIQQPIPVIVVGISNSLPVLVQNFPVENKTAISFPSFPSMMDVRIIGLSSNLDVPVSVENPIEVSKVENVVGVDLLGVRGTAIAFGDSDNDFSIPVKVVSSEGTISAKTYSAAVSSDQDKISFDETPTDKLLKQSALEKAEIIWKKFMDSYDIHSADSLPKYVLVHGAYDKFLHFVNTNPGSKAMEAYTNFLNEASPGL